MKGFNALTVIVLCVVVLVASGCASEASGQEHQNHDHRAQGGAQEPLASTDPVLTSYLTIQSALAADSTEGVTAAANSLREAASAHRGQGGQRGEVSGELVRAATALRGADLEASRETFKALSQQMIRYRAMTPGVLSQTTVVHCPMANASWVQATEAVSNPYHGASMLRCGEVTKQRGVR